MKFHDIFQTTIIFLLFGICFMVSFMSIGLNNIRTNWVLYRCNPVIMPFASFFGHDPIKNFTQCISNIQSDTIVPHIAPLAASHHMALKSLSGLTDTMNNFRIFNSKFRPSLAGGFSSMFGVFQNLVIELQKFATGFKDLIMKILGVMTTILYMTTGQSMLGSSIIKGPFIKAIHTVGDFCFHPLTPVLLKTNKTVSIKDLKLGDVLENGAVVNGILRLRGEKNNKYYKLWSHKLQQFIFVTGSHKVLNNSLDVFENYIEVKSHEFARKTDIWDEELYCLITSSHRIRIGEYTFWDWED